MTGLSNYAKGKLMDHALAVTAYTAPTNVYAQLYTVAPADDGTGGTPTGARVLADMDSYAVPSSLNEATVDFASITPALVIVAVGIFDASTSGNLLYVADISPGYAVTGSGTVSFNIGSLILGLD